MINENMKKVLVALRSGEYKQTSRLLNDCHGHCCLGVMCEVYEKETGNKLDRDGDGFIIGRTLGNQKGVQKWVELNNAFGGDDVNNSLVMKNDVLHSTFSEIADFIESEPEGLLV